VIWINQKNDLPFLVLSCGHKLGVSGGLDISSFFKLVHVHSEFHLSVECLHVSGESTESHEGEIVDLEDSLEGGVDSHELLTESSISSDSYAVLSSHSDHGVTVVLILLEIKLCKHMLSILSW
jgi:hypothetical protein